EEDRSKPVVATAQRLRALVNAAGGERAAGFVEAIAAHEIPRGITREGRAPVSPGQRDAAIDMDGARRGVSPDMAVRGGEIVADRIQARRARAIAWHETVLDQLWTIPQCAGRRQDRVAPQIAP